MADMPRVRRHFWGCESCLFRYVQLKFPQIKPDVAREEGALPARRCTRYFRIRGHPVLMYCWYLSLCLRAACTRYIYHVCKCLMACTVKELRLLSGTSF